MDIWCVQCNKPVDTVEYLEACVFPRLYEPAYAKAEVLVRCHGRKTILDAGEIRDDVDPWDEVRLFAFFESEELEDRDNPD
jgi:hypothetical protein